MDKMYNKVGVLTFHSSNNYGALLQCYALSKTLEDFGLNVSIINIRKEYIKDISEKKFIAKNKYLAKDFIENSIFQKEFDIFRDKYLRGKFTKSIKKIEELKSFSETYDAVIVGSDQVWRYAYTKNTQKSFFLDFVSDKTIKVSYAASFGLDYFEGDAELEATIKKLINRFDDVSVREDVGVAICKNKFGIEAAHVLDPVFLLNSHDYENIITEEKDNIEEPYLAYYLLNTDKFRTELISNTLKFSNLKKTINIYTNERFSFRKPSFPISKFKFKSFSSWLKILKNAKFIVTDSFHGLAFSIIFNKQFICIANKARGASRMKSILSLMGLEHRLIFEGQDTYDLNNMNKVDYEIVNKKLQFEKNKSLIFLQKALKVIR